MDHQTVMQTLESMGTEQNRKTYGRHGVGQNMFGVSYANLGALTKRIKKNQPLAESLWATGNHDARVLATMIAGPQEVTSQLLDQWVLDLDNHTIADAFAGVVAQSAFAQEKLQQWIQSDNEFIAQAGWTTLARLTTNPAIEDHFFESYLPQLQATIHQVKNRTREAMNNALISIGVRNAQLQYQALAMADHIGVVHVDHGETNCKTPDARTYILKTVAHRQKKAAKA